MFNCCEQQLISYCVHIRETEKKRNSKTAYINQSLNQQEFEQHILQSKDGGA